MKLTEQQTKAIKHNNGIALVNSGAGSGKTQVFVSRIINLIANEKVDASSILGVTFTRHAADNMRERINKFLKNDLASLVNLTTFHSFARNMLLTHFPLEYANKDIPKAWWKMRVVSDILGEKTYKNPDGLDIMLKPGELLAFIAYQKANMVRKGDTVIIDKRVNYASDVPEWKLQKAYDTYCELSENANVLDFDDMLLHFYYKLKENPSFLDKLKSKYKYIMVDEFQDTSKINMEILKLLYDKNLFVVGDFRQSIMGFNNSHIDNILGFTKSFKDVELINLPHNFRSTNQIINICNNIIDKSPIEEYKQFDNQISGKEIDGKDVLISLYNNDIFEINDIIDNIEKINNESDLTYNDFCILCRTNAQLANFESFLSDRDIPARLSSQGSFFDRKEITDILAYALHAVDRNHDMSFREIINVPNRFISNNSIHKLDALAKSKDISLEKAVTNNDVENQVKFLNIIKVFNELSKHINLPAHKFLKKLYKIVGYEEHINEKSRSNIEIQTKLESIEKLFEIAERYPNISSFLRGVEIIKANSKNKDIAVNVMTVHASKGLEFDTVYVSGVTDHMFPHPMNETDIEEERRLLYVACSRAINNLSLSCNLSNYGINEKILPSPFLMDIAEEKINDGIGKLNSGVNKVSFYY